MALVDFDYEFLAIDIGVQGRISDGGVFKNSAMYYAMENNTIKPPPRPLPLLNEEGNPLPLVFVGNDAIQLTKCCMKPYGCKTMTQMINTYFTIAFQVNEK